MGWKTHFRFIHPSLAPGPVNFQPFQTNPENLPDPRTSGRVTRAATGRGDSAGAARPSLPLPGRSSSPWDIYLSIYFLKFFKLLF